MPLNSAQRKTLAKIWQKPTRNDITYQKAESLIKALGGHIKPGKGSHFKPRLRGFGATIKKPHGGAKHLDEGAVEDLRNLFKMAGVQADGSFQDD